MGAIGTQITLIEQMNADKCGVTPINGTLLLTVSADIYPCFYLYCHYNGTDEYPRKQVQLMASELIYLEDIRKQMMNTF